MSTAQKQKLENGHSKLTEPKADKSAPARSAKAHDKLFTRV
jgi:hypothetical protein